MTHQMMNGDDKHRLIDIVAADEKHTSFGQQALNGLSGLLVLLVTGVIIVLLVLWKSP